MKRLLDLTNADLMKQPIWKYLGDGDEAAYIKPMSAPRSFNGVYIAKTQFILASGQTMFGYCSPAETSSIDYVRPVIIHRTRHIPFWRDGVGLIPSQQIADELGLPLHAVFPVIYRSLVATEEGFWQDSIEFVG
jgi:hypothetical protein